MERESSSCSQTPNVKGRREKIFALKGGKSEKKTTPNQKTEIPSPTIKATDIAGEERDAREEVMRRALAVPGLTRCVCTSSEAGATPASRFLSRRFSWEFCGSTAVFPGLRSPGSARQPQHPVTSPCPSLKSLQRS